MLVEFAIGDAYAAAFEFVDRELTRDHQLGDYARHPRHEIAPGSYTDDTQMSIAVAELIVSSAPFTRENLADCFVQAFQRDPRTDRAFVGNYQRLGYLSGDEMIELAPHRQVDNVRPEFNEDRPQATLPIDEASALQAIAYYQTASYRFSHGLMTKPATAVPAAVAAK